MLCVLTLSKYQKGCENVRKVKAMFRKTIYLRKGSF